MLGSAGSIIASAMAPGGAPAETFRGLNCLITYGGPGQIQLDVDEEGANAGNTLLLLSPGPGSDLAQGISFGQSSQSGRRFLFTVYRNDTGAAASIPVCIVVIGTGG